MKVLHSGVMDTASGGPAMSIYLTVKGVRQEGVDADVITFSLLPGRKMRGNDIPVSFTPQPIIKRFSYSPVYARDIKRLGDRDIYHAQGVWKHYTYALVDVARELNKPYVITPRGMLYPQDIAKSSTLFKKLSLKWRLLRDLNNAACIHVTCVDEMIHCRNLGVTSPMAVVPNPVEIKDYNITKKDNTFRFGYLGRVSRRKNIHGLIKAFIELGELVRDAELLIIGDGDKLYMNELRQLASQVIYGKVVFAGFLNGEEKDEALASCSVLVMPSEFENLGNVILEGLVRRIPCIATTGAPWQELNSEHCGWQVPFNQDDITAAMKKALQTSIAELELMGQNGRSLMEKRYSVEAVARQMRELYEWILGERKKPEFVYLYDK